MGKTPYGCFNNATSIERTAMTTKFLKENMATKLQLFLVVMFLL
jgi:hypothetical protein